MLRKWHEVVRSARYWKTIKSNLLSRYDRIWLRQAFRAWNRWHRTARIVKYRYARVDRKLLEQSISWWLWARAFSKDEQQKVRRITNIDKRYMHYRRLKLLRLCMQAWEQTLLTQDTKRSRARQVDRLLLGFQPHSDHARLTVFFLAWTRSASIAKMRKKGFKRAKRQWIGYTRRAVLSKCFDFWRDDAESERISRQMFARSVHFGVRRLLLRIVETWKDTVVMRTECQKSEKIVFLKIRKNAFQVKAGVLSEWHGVVAMRRAWIRFGLWVQHHHQRLLEREILAAWHESAISYFTFRHAVSRVLLLRQRSSMRTFLLGWRWKIDDTRSLEIQVRFCFLEG